MFSEGMVYTEESKGSLQKKRWQRGLIIVLLIPDAKEFCNFFSGSPHLGRGFLIVCDNNTDMLIDREKGKTWCVDFFT